MAKAGSHGGMTGSEGPPGDTQCATVEKLRFVRPAQDAADQPEHVQRAGDLGMDQTEVGFLELERLAQRALRRPMIAC